MEFINYLLQVSGCIAIFYLLYFSLFKHENFSQLNRIYLVLSVFIAFIIPIIPTFFVYETTAEWIKTVDFQQIIIIDDLPSPEIQNGKILVETPTNYLTWQNILLFAYLIGVLFSLIRFLLNLSKIIWQIKTNEKIQKDSYVLIKSHQTAICSFGKYIFWNDNLEFTSTEKQQILEHELIHVNEKHTIDILLFELVIIVLWFNPFIYFYKNALRNVHEYIADSYVFNDLKYKSRYAKLLLKEAAIHNRLSSLSYPMAHNFFNSITKKRLIMLSKVTHPFRRLKLLIVLPILAVLCLAFTVKNTILPVESSSSILTPIEELPVNKKSDLAVIPETIVPVPDTSKPNIKLSKREVTIYKEEPTKTIGIEKRTVNVPVSATQSAPKPKTQEISSANPMKNAKPGQIFYAYGSDEKSFNEDGSLKTEEEIKDALIKHLEAKAYKNIDRKDIIIVTPKDMEEVIGSYPKKPLEEEIKTTEWVLDWSGIQNDKLNDMTEINNQQFKIMNKEGKQISKIISYGIIVKVGGEKGTNYIKHNIEPTTDGNMFPNSIFNAIKKIETLGTVTFFDIRFELEGKKYITQGSFIYEVK